MKNAKKDENALFTLDFQTNSQSTHTDFERQRIGVCDLILEVLSFSIYLYLVIFLLTFVPAYIFSGCRSQRRLQLEHIMDKIFQANIHFEEEKINILDTPLRVKYKLLAEELAPFTWSEQLVYIIQRFLCGLRCSNYQR